MRSACRRLSSDGPPVVAYELSLGGAVSPGGSPGGAAAAAVRGWSTGTANDLRNRGAGHVRARRRGQSFAACGLSGPSLLCLPLLPIGPWVVMPTALTGWRTFGPRRWLCKRARLRRSRWRLHRRPRGQGSLDGCACQRGSQRRTHSISTSAWLVKVRGTWPGD